MNLKALLGAFLVFCLAQSGESTSVSRAKKSVSALHHKHKSAAKAAASTHVPPPPEYNVLQNVIAGQPLPDKTYLNEIFVNPTVAIADERIQYTKFQDRWRARMSRMSLAAGFTMNHPEVRGVSFALKETIARWFNIGVFIADKKGLEVKDVIADLFQLGDLPKHQYFNFDRSGSFLDFSKNLDYRINQILEVMKDGNLRELGHVSARLSGACEDAGVFTDAQLTSLFAPGSAEGDDKTKGMKSSGQLTRFCARNIIQAIYENLSTDGGSWKETLQKAPYFFNYDHLQFQAAPNPEKGGQPFYTGEAKTFFAPIRGTEVALARSKAKIILDKQTITQDQFDGMTEEEKTKLKSHAELSRMMRKSFEKTSYTSLNIGAMGIQLLSPREQFALSHPPPPALGKTPAPVDARYGVKWGFGAGSFWEVDQNSATETDYQTKSRWASLYYTAGPSGTTEEQLQLTNFVNGGKDCFLNTYARNWAISNMISYNHHSFHEIMLGGHAFIYNHPGTELVKAKCDYPDYDLEFPFETVVLAPSAPAAPPTPIMLKKPSQMTESEKINAPVPYQLFAAPTRFEWFQSLNYAGPDGKPVNVDWTVRNAELSDKDPVGLKALMSAYYEVFGTPQSVPLMDFTERIDIFEELFHNEARSGPDVRYVVLEQAWLDKVVKKLEQRCADAPKSGCNVGLDMMHKLRWYPNSRNLIFPSRVHPYDEVPAFEDALLQEYKRMEAHRSYQVRGVDGKSAEGVPFSPLEFCTTNPCQCISGVFVLPSITSKTVRSEMSPSVALSGGNQ